MNRERFWNCVGIILLISFIIGLFLWARYSANLEDLGQSQACQEIGYTHYYYRDGSCYNQTSVQPVLMICDGFYNENCLAVPKEAKE